MSYPENTELAELNPEAGIRAPTKILRESVMGSHRWRTTRVDSRTKNDLRHGGRHADLLEEFASSRGVFLERLEGVELLPASLEGRFMPSLVAVSSAAVSQLSSSSPRP